MNLLLQWHQFILAIRARYFVPATRPNLDPLGKPIPILGMFAPNPEFVRRGQAIVEEALKRKRAELGRELTEGERQEVNEKTVIEDFLFLTAGTRCTNFLFCS